MFLTIYGVENRSVTAAPGFDNSYKFMCVSTGALLSVVVVVTFSFTFNPIKVKK